MWEYVLPYGTLGRDFFRQAPAPDLSPLFSSTCSRSKYLHPMLASCAQVARIQSMIHDMIEDLKMVLTDWSEPLMNIGLLMIWGGLATILCLAVCSL